MRDMMCWDCILSVMAIVITVILGGIAIYIARKSDEKMKITADERFLSIVGTLEDRRIEFRNHGGDLPFHIWKCYTDLERVNLFKEYMTPGQQDRIINYLKLEFELLKFFKDNQRWLTGKALSEADNHIRGMYKIVESLDVFEESKHKETLQKLKEELTIDTNIMSLKEPAEDNNCPFYD